ncbi:MAG: prenyltransferase [Proteobacteria bacterium]|nr:prenyltransferase [Pseudomonadota bacterium]
MRLPFLILPPACVALGTATAAWSGSKINLIYLFIVFVGSLAAHISVNALNEYDDFKSGLDLNTRRTPFSGGSGTLPANPDKAHIALITGLVALGMTALIGAYFVYVRGLWLLPLGMLGLINIVTYTRWQTRRPLLCLLAPGLGFGPMMVMGTHFVLTGSYNWTSFVASLVPFFLVSDLLLLNQFPDVEPDKRIGRYHLPIVIGRKASVKVYSIFLAGAYVSIIIGYFLGVFPKVSLIALASIVLAVATVKGAARYADDIPKLIPYMGRNVVIIIVTPVLLAISLFVG